MPNYYIENAEKWKALANIDYFTHFVKAWIPFNAWYRNSFTALDSDAEIMQEIKTTHNRFKDKLVTLIEGNSEDNEIRIFKMHLSDLHYHLERYPIYNNGERVSFLNLVVERNTKTIESMTYRTFVYKVETDIANRKRISTSILDKNAAVRLMIVQTNGYSAAEIEANPDYQRLPPELKAKAKTCYQSVNPRKPVCLLTTDEGDFIDVGTYHFINDAELISKAVITVIYMLRNALFHGQIIPDKDTQKVYEPAYHVLSTLVEGLV